MKHLLPIFLSHKSQAKTVRLTLLLFALPSFAPAATFQLLGDLSGGATRGVAKAISADGTVVAGRGQTDSATLGWVWTASTGIQALPSPGTEERSDARSMSDDGSIIVGEARADVNSNSKDHAVVWTRQVNGSYSAQALVPPAGSKFGLFIGSTLFDLDMQAYAVSGNGTTIVGQGRSYESGTVGSTFEAFHWTAATGIVPSGNLSGGPTVTDGTTTKPSYSSARSIDRLANFSVGTSRSAIRPNSTSTNSEAFRFFFPNSSMTGIGDLQNPVFSSTAQAISKDGTTIVGEARDPINGQVAFRYTDSSGMVSLGALEPGNGQTIACAVSADGSVVVGRSAVTAPAFTNSTSRAFIWTASLGLVRLSTAAGLTSTDLGPNGFLEEALAISDDGLTVVGAYGDATDDPNHPPGNGSQTEFQTPKRQAFIITFTPEELGLSPAITADELAQNSCPAVIPASSSLDLTFNFREDLSFIYTLQFSPDLQTTFTDQVSFTPDGNGSFTRQNIAPGYNGTASLTSSVLTETISSSLTSGYWRIRVSSP
ncbi:MAG: hypothetical protein AAGC74_09515 [Verrucomicrobiota bacterium]